MGKVKFMALCPTKVKEGEVEVDCPAGEVCPICKREKGMGMNQCNFVLRRADAPNILGGSGQAYLSGLA